MKLPSYLVSRFAKLTTKEKEESKETTVYGTIREVDGLKYVQIDGAEVLTPVTTTVEFKSGERVTVMLKNHTATVTGNITSPSRNSSVGDLEEEVKKQATIIDNSAIHQGTTSPKNPVPGKTLWLDFSSDPPMLKQYTEDELWDSVGTDKVQTSYIGIRNEQIDIRSGGLVNVNSGGSVSIKAGGNFTVDATNLTIDADGTIRAKKAMLTEASINGNVTVNGYPVWHAGNLVIGSKAPSNPVVGTVWISPEDTTLQGTYSCKIDRDIIDLDSEGGEIIAYLSGPALGTIDSTYNITYRLRVAVHSNNRHGPHKVGGLLVYKDSDGLTGTRSFPLQTISTKGLTFYDQLITTDDLWLGNDTVIRVDFGLYGGEWGGIADSYGDMFVDTGYDLILDIVAVSKSSKGWQGASVKYFCG